MEEKQLRKVIHVTLKGEPEEHLYFGSMSAIYDHLTKDDVGITYSTLRNVGLSPQKPYENKLCVIREGVLQQKKTNRGIQQ